MLGGVERVQMKRFPRILCAGGLRKVFAAVGQLTEASGGDRGSVGFLQGSLAAAVTPILYLSHLRECVHHK
jgi:hypothetical protein